jgi:NADPH2:quinone reductase
MSFRAFRIHTDNNTTRAGLEQLTLDDLTSGEVVIEAHWSGVNYKDALAGTGQGKILRKSPLVGGIDVSGVVVESKSDEFHVGDEVLVTGAGLSEIYDGGYAEYVRVKAECVVPLPRGLTLFEAMAMGTPAFTAALALQRMEENRQNPSRGPIVITGASGGVGSLAIDIFATGGYEVVALTSKQEHEESLKQFGAKRVLLRSELDMGTAPLEQGQWGGAVDTVGGDTLAWLTRTTKERGNIASIGLADEAEFNTTVMPFILRGINLLGISSANCPAALRRKIWKRLGYEIKPQHLDNIVSNTITLDELPAAFDAMLASKSHGRTVVKIK